MWPHLEETKISSVLNHSALWHVGLFQILTNYILHILNEAYGVWSLRQYQTLIFHRPGVAGTILQTALSSLSDDLSPESLK